MLKLVSLGSGMISWNAPLPVGEGWKSENEQNPVTLDKHSFHIFQNFWVFSTDSKRGDENCGGFAYQILKNVKNVDSVAVWKVVVFQLFEKPPNVDVTFSTGFRLRTITPTLSDVKNDSESNGVLIFLIWGLLTPKSANFVNHVFAIFLCTFCGLDLHFYRWPRTFLA